ncbi:hypothetical protein JCM19583_13170 [Halopiger thermotolerans]
MIPEFQFRDAVSTKQTNISEMMTPGRSRRECELCRTRKLTTEEYGMHVCGACKQTYLP